MLITQRMVSMLGLFKKQNVVRGERNEELPLTHEGLPDSFRPNGLCPRCGKQSSFEIAGELPVTFSKGVIIQHSGNTNSPKGYSDKATCLICRHCEQCVIVIEEEWIGEQPSRLGFGKGGVVSYRGIHWWPLPHTKLSKDIPQDVSNIFDEAVTTYYANAPRATAVMLRRTVESIAVHFGETEGVLANRLKSMAEKNILQPSLADWAKEVRLIGNQGAHFDPANDVSMEDAKQLLTFVQELLRYLFELPAELQRRRGL